MTGTDVAFADVDATLALLRAADATIDEPLQRGQFDVRDAIATYAPDGTFDGERMLEAVRAEHVDALAQGYAGLSMTGDVGAGLNGVPGDERLARYEQRLDAELGGDTRVLLCQYDHPRIGPETIADAAAAHHVDVSGQLAATAARACRPRHACILPRRCVWRASWTSNLPRASPTPLMPSFGDRCWTWPT